jgi:hypothetical protein
MDLVEIRIDWTSTDLQNRMFVHFITVNTHEKYKLQAPSHDEYLRVYELWRNDAKSTSAASLDFPKFVTLHTPYLGGFLNVKDARNIWEQLIDNKWHPINCNHERKINKTCP